MDSFWRQTPKILALAVKGALARRSYEAERSNLAAYYAGYLSHDFKDGFPAYRDIFPAPPPPGARRFNAFAKLQHNLRQLGAIAEARNPAT